MVSVKSWHPPLPKSLLASISFLKQYAGDRKFSTSSQGHGNWVVPLDIVIEVSERLESTEDILSLSLTSTCVYATLLPVLYASVDLRSSRMCKNTISMLSNSRSDASRHIRRLVVCPNHVDLRSQQPAKHIDEDWVAQSIIKLASAGRLKRLTSFFWDGSDMPQDDSLWSTLRRCCPDLRAVGSNVGPRTINPESELFRFEDLSGFTLTAKTLPNEWDTILPPEPELPNQLWDMLIVRSPRLEQLRIDVSQRSRRVWDTRRIIQGRWPQLRDLEMGDCSMANNNSTRASMEAPFMQFLAMHSSLERLRLPSLSSFPKAIILPPSSLPHLKVFCGNFAHIKGLPHPRITSLSLIHQPLSQKNLVSISASLKHMQCLTSLSIWLHLDAQTDHYAAFRSLLDSCRGLKYLDLACSEAPWGMIEFTSALRGSRVELITLSLTRVERAADEPDLHKIATRLATHTPSLRKISLRYSFTSWVFLDCIPYRRVGTFAVKERSKEGGTVVVERRPRSYGRLSYRRPLSLQLLRW